MVVLMVIGAGVDAGGGLMLTIDTLVTYSVVSLGDAVTVLVNFSVIGGEVLVTTTVTGAWSGPELDPVSDPDPDPDPVPEPEPDPEPEPEPEPEPLPPSMGTTE